MKKKLVITTAVLILLLVLFFSCSKKTPSEPEPTLAEKLQEALDSELGQHNGIGASAAVLIPGQNIWLGVSGVSHGTTPISANMIFNIASVTKTFSAALILQLMEEGALALEDSLHKWLPSYPSIDSTITIRQLLNHTSGIFNFSENPIYEDNIRANMTGIWSPEETVTTFVLEPYYLPGTAYHYSNTNNYLNNSFF